MSVHCKFIYLSAVVCAEHPNGKHCIADSAGIEMHVRAFSAYGVIAYDRISEQFLHAVLYALVCAGLRRYGIHIVLISKES